VFRPTVLAIRKEKDMRRARHQKGSLQRVKRKSGESVWIFRWYEVHLDGTKRYRKAVIGSVQEYRMEADAQRAADALRLEINEQTPRQQLQAISMETLVEHYRQHELPDIVPALTRKAGNRTGPAHCIALRCSRHSRLLASQGRSAGTLCGTASAH
jgi:hypothetical protein